MRTQRWSCWSRSWRWCVAAGALGRVDASGYRPLTVFAWQTRARAAHARVCAKVTVAAAGRRRRPSSSAGRGPSSCSCTAPATRPARGRASRRSWSRSHRSSSPTSPVTATARRSTGRSTSQTVLEGVEAVLDARSPRAEKVVHRRQLARRLGRDAGRERATRSASRWRVVRRRRRDHGAATVRARVAAEEPAPRRASRSTQTARPGERAGPRLRARRHRAPGARGAARPLRRQRRDDGGVRARRDAARRAPTCRCGSSGAPPTG